MTERTFSDYVAEKKQSYRYTVKFAVDTVDDTMIDSLEECLSRYKILAASAFKSTPIQLSPLDFPNVKNTPVHITDIELAYPASLDFLRTHICNSLGISQQQVVVYSENDPRQIETDLFIERNSPEFKEKYKTVLGSEYEQTAAPKYGNDYNMDFLKTLAKIQSEREITIADSPLNPDKMPTSDMAADYHSYLDVKNTPSDDTGLFGRIKRPIFKG